jgi:hypothetical protein
MLRTSPIVAAAGIAVAATAQADVIRFSNPGGMLDWVPQILAGPGYFDLDITQPATQSGAASPIGVHWFHNSPTSSTMGVVHNAFTGASARIVRSTIPVSAPVNPPGNTDLFPPFAFAPGQSVGPGLNWQQSADLGWLRFAAGDNYIVGTSFTMGVQITLGDGVHYGYIDFTLGPSHTYSITQYQPTGWGYESVAGVPLVVPGPGAGLIAFAAAAAHRRRPRKSQPA